MVTWGCNTCMYDMDLYTIIFPITNVFVHINDKHTPSRPLGEVKFVRVELVL